MGPDLGVAFCPVRLADILYSFFRSQNQRARRAADPSAKRDGWQALTTGRAWRASRDLLFSFHGFEPRPLAAVTNIHDREPARLNAPYTYDTRFANRLQYLFITLLYHLWVETDIINRWAPRAAGFATRLSSRLDRARRGPKSARARRSERRADLHRKAVQQDTGGPKLPPVARVANFCDLRR